MADNPLTRVEPLWGAQTQHAIDNFQISGQPMPAAVIRALAVVKEAAARINAELGVVDHGKAEAIAGAAAEIASGRWADQFPVDVFQTGSGTSTNMNMNEVIASLASQRLGYAVHPNDEVNASQSSNDVIPTAVHLAIASDVKDRLLPAIAQLTEVLQRKSDEHADSVKPGRTHLMDAVPVTLGQEFGGYAAQARLSTERLQSSLPRVLDVPLGGTATGTGINAPPQFAARALTLIRELTGVDVREGANRFEGQSTRDSLVELSGQLRAFAVSLTKICNDLRLMNSGPTAGMGEIRLPALQAGSSIMPGKVNPVIPEAVVMACTQVMGNDVAVAVAGSQGHFELNAMIPVISRNVLESIALLTNSALALADKVVPGIEVDVEALRHAAERSPAIATALNRYLGYDEVAAIVKQSLADGRTIKDVTIARGHVSAGSITEAQLDEALDVLRMTRPN